MAAVIKRSNGRLPPVVIDERDEGDNGLEARMSSAEASEMMTGSFSRTGRFALAVIEVVTWR
jgi:hypothetical protein